MGPMKYKCLSITDKKKVIAAVEAGGKKDVALRFGISNYRVTAVFCVSVRAIDTVGLG